MGAGSPERHDASASLKEAAFADSSYVPQSDPMPAATCSQPQPQL